MSPIGALLNVYAGVAQSVEQLICNQQVAGSSPSTSSRVLGEERFPSGQRGQTVNLLAQPSEVRILPSPPCVVAKAGIAQLARASAFQAEGRGFESRFPLQYARHTAGHRDTVSPHSSVVERFLGKEEVIGSMPIVGSIAGGRHLIMIFSARRLPDGEEKV